MSAAKRLTVLLSAWRECPGTWIVHCLDYDIVTQGEGLAGATAALSEALDFILEDDERIGYDSSLRRAPQHMWPDSNSQRDWCLSL